MRTVEFPFLLKGLKKHWTVSDGFQKVCRGIMALALAISKSLT